MKLLEEQAREFLRKLADTTGGKSNRSVGCLDIGRQLGFEPSLTIRIIGYLKNKGWIRYVSAGPVTSGTIISITEEGLNELSRTL
jgi:CTP-dependent riboflavin kinase